VPKHRYELRSGAMLALGTRWTAWGDMALQRGAADYRSVAGQMGISAHW
jgi:hypothetical protein